MRSPNFISYIVLLIYHYFWSWFVDMQAHHTYLFEVLLLVNNAFAQVYYVYGFMLLVFLILVIVTVCVTIVSTYFLLNAENYHWQWTSFAAAASTSLCVHFHILLLGIIAALFHQ